MHAWEIIWNQRQRGTHAVIGVATSEATLHANGYQNLVGATTDSWGWDIGRNKLFHDSKHLSPCDYPHQVEQDFLVPDSFICILDMDEGTLGFMTDGTWHGIAFKGLKGKILYPIVSAVWGHAEVTMRYIAGLDRELFLIPSVTG